MEFIEQKINLVNVLLVSVIEAFLWKHALIVLQTALICFGEPQLNWQKQGCFLEDNKQVAQETNMFFENL